MKRKKLNQHIYKNYMTAALIPILFIELALVVLYFSINGFVSKEMTKKHFQHSTASVASLIRKEAEIINNKFLEVSKMALLLQREHEQFFKTLHEKSYKEEAGFFKVDKNGAMFKYKNNGGSALYYSSDTKIGEKELKKALLSESFDNSFKSAVNDNPLISQAYINTYDNMNRIYPYIRDIAEQYGPILTMTDYNFYYEADFFHNPTKKPVWTSAYLDPAGMGWMMSCIVPIYNETFLEGVTGLDITIEKLVQHVLTMDLPNKSNSFIVDHNGMILAMDEKTEHLFNLNELKKHKYVTTIQKTIYKPEEFNIFNHSDQNIKETFSNIYEENLDMLTATINDKEMLINHQLIPETGWHLFVLTDMKVLTAPITELKRISIQAGIAAIVIMVLFYISLFFYFMIRSQKFAAKICKPIEALSENTKYVGTEFFSYDYEETDIEEIEQLNINFDEMTNKLENRTKELIRTEVEKLESEQEAEKFLLMSITDPLTKLNNRLKIDEILDYEISQSKRYDSTLSVLICDLDHFKRVNDNYGHQTGDKVLIEFAKILRENIRMTDTAARWGGEEFIIVFTNTTATDASEIAEKLRIEIEKHNFPIEGALTASFGVTQYINSESKENFIKRADDALYAAKAASRNTVVTK